MKRKPVNVIQAILLLIFLCFCVSCKTVNSPPVLPVASAPKTNTLEESSVTPEGVVEDQSPPGVPIIEATAD